MQQEDTQYPIHQARKWYTTTHLWSSCYTCWSVDDQWSATVCHRATLSPSYASHQPVQSCFHIYNIYTLLESLWRLTHCFMTAACARNISKYKFHQPVKTLTVNVRNSLRNACDLHHMPPWYLHKALTCSQPPASATRIPIKYTSKRREEDIYTLVRVLSGTNIIPWRDFDSVQPANPSS